MGDKDEGIACVEVNVDFGYEETVSKMILAEMKKGELDAFTLFALQDDIRNAIGKPQTKQAEVKQHKPVQETSIFDMANNGNPEAQRELGSMYYTGKNVNKNYNKAAYWYLKAAEQGESSAQHLLGYLYYKGLIERDYKKAYVWFSLSLIFGGSNPISKFIGTDSSDYLKDIEEGGWFSSPKLSPDEIREAKAEVQIKYEEIRKRIQR